MSIVVDFFGNTSDKEEVKVYKLKNKNGLEAHVIDQGAALMRLFVPDKDGALDDVVLGFEDAKSYEVNAPSFGATVGRNANRIKDAKVNIDGVMYKLEKNDGNNNLHGGGKGFGRVSYEALLDEGKNTVIFRRISPDMEQGFPGNLVYEISYTLTDDNELIIHYLAKSDKTTVVNMTNHSYFNLKGHKEKSALDHLLMIDADMFTSAGDDNVPDGGFVDVTNTPMDFRSFKPLGKDIRSDYKPLVINKGYDHNYVLHVKGKEVIKVAELKEETKGRTMEVYTNSPGLQLYTANFLEPEEGCAFKDNADYGCHDAVCLETQMFPNSCNIKEFPSSILKPGETYDFTTIYKFV